MTAGTATDGDADSLRSPRGQAPGLHSAHARLHAPHAGLHATWALVREAFPCRELGERDVKGVPRPILTYEIDPGEVA